MTVGETSALFELSQYDLSTIDGVSGVAVTGEGVFREYAVDDYRPVLG